MTWVRKASLIHSVHKNKDSRTWLEIQSGLRSPLWLYLDEVLKEKISDMRATASRMHMANQDDVSTRDELLYGANALEDFFNSAPHTIEENYKEAVEKENQND